MIPVKQVWAAGQRCRPPITTYPDCTGLIINVPGAVSRETKNSLVDEGKYLVTVDAKGDNVLLGH